MKRYDLTAEIYEERYRGEQKEKYAAALVDVDVLGSRILDAGCGSGLFFEEVAAHSRTMVGVDISRKLLRKAKKQADAFGNVFVLQADADHLPFADGVFDFVFSFTVLQNMPKPAETLDEFKRVTNLGGKVVVTGLKRAFSPITFMDFIGGSGLNLVSFVDSGGLNCYIAVLAT